AEVVTLIDHAVNTYAKPYPREAAPYIWHRAQALEADGRPREAVKDYNEFHTLMGGQVSAAFYYHRAQAALAGRLNQMAVDDIHHAVEMNPDNVDYLIEKASICTRFNLSDEGITTCKRIIELTPEYPDAYRLLGLCYIHKGDKKAARTAFLRAKELGDPHA
ncbi:tetratricopeptide repeat protein, partial [Escherichia coli]|uniref:tetratricopeptide repeat protein n=1 Tax=Escherichia coli TaxID=562 RepID=UPI001592BEC0